jgi:hypothetical protein
MIYMWPSTVSISSSLRGFCSQPVRAGHEPLPESRVCTASIVSGQRSAESPRTELRSMAPSERGGDVAARREPVCRSVVSSVQRRAPSSERRAIYSRCGLQATLMASLPRPAHRQKPPRRVSGQARRRCQRALLGPRRADGHGRWPAKGVVAVAPWRSCVRDGATSSIMAWHTAIAAALSAASYVVVVGGCSCLGCSAVAPFVCARRIGKAATTPVRLPGPVCQVASTLGPTMPEGSTRQAPALAHHRTSQQSVVSVAVARIILRKLMPITQRSCPDRGLRAVCLRLCKAP